LSPASQYQAMLGFGDRTLKLNDDIDGSIRTEISQLGIKLAGA
jgi:hypothetical protein